MSNPNDKDDYMPDPHEESDCPDSQQTAGYEVGYRKPPVATQFKKGRSGNLKGRPKGSPNIAKTLSRLADEQISVRDGDKIRKLSRSEVLLITLFQRAHKGDVRASTKLLDLLHKYGLAKTPEEAQVGGVLRVPEPCLTQEEWVARHGTEGLRTIEQIEDHRREMNVACDKLCKERREAQAWAIEVKQRWGAEMRDLPPEYKGMPREPKK